MDEPKKEKRGGKRQGAGRKPTGRKAVMFYITEQEKSEIREYLKKLRAAD